jgi:uncharacterized protein
MSFLRKFTKQGIITPPKWLDTNLAYECIMGSRAYGCHTEDSDYDIYGWAFPPKSMLFPATVGLIRGFDSEPDVEKPLYDKQEFVPQGYQCGYSFTVYGISRYFKLCMDNNPNMLDSMYVPESCITHATEAARILLTNRSKFLSKEVWPRYRNYAANQIKKLKNAGNLPEVSAIRSFEDKYNIPHITTLEEIEQELKDRGLVV